MMCPGHLRTVKAVPFDISKKTVSIFTDQNLTYESIMPPKKGFNSRRSAQRNATWLEAVQQSNAIQQITRPTPNGSGHRQKGRTLQSKFIHFKNTTLKNTTSAGTPCGTLLQNKYHTGASRHRCTKCGFPSRLRV